MAIDHRVAEERLRTIADALGADGDRHRLIAATDRDVGSRPAPLCAGAPGAVDEQSIVSA